MNTSTFVVITRVRGVSRTQIWDSSAPLTIGHPLRWIIEKTREGVRARKISGALNQTQSPQILTLSNTSLDPGASIVADNLEIQIRRADKPRIIPFHPTPALAQADARDISEFQKQLRYALSAFAVFTLIAFVWPKPQPSEELIPAQIAKIVLAPVKTLKGQKEAGGSPGNANPAKAQNTAVVQAFRAKALQSSISGLLKGGMTRLLAQSDFAAGSDPSASAKRIFNTNAINVLATGNEIGSLNSKQVLVASLGGGGMGGSGGGIGIGYGKGHKAGVTGQGNSQVSLDMGNSNVEEGLTKDEVGEVIHKHLSEVRYCYESAILRTAGIEGRLIVNFTIAGAGNVKTSEIKTSNLPDPRLDDCILRRLVTWKFPQTKGGIDVAVSYPFIFKTLGR